MMNYVVTKIVTWLINNEVIAEKDRELYEYAGDSILITLVSVFLVVVLGSFIGNLVTSIALILPFMVIRKFSGGFHAKHVWTCLCCSSALLVVCFWIASKIRFHVLLGVITVLAVISLATFSPVDSESRRLQSDEKKEYKKKAGRIALGILGITVLLLKCGEEKLAVHVAV